MTFDNFFKRSIEEFLESAPEIRVTDDKSVGTLPLKIDLIIEIKNSSANIRNLLPILTQRFKRQNIIEFKSAHDKTSIDNLSKLIGYFGLFAEQERINIIHWKNEITLWYISAAKPKFLETLVDSGIIEEESEKGLYSIKTLNFLKIYIIIIEEMEMKQENYPLLLNLWGTRLGDVVQRIIADGLATNEYYDKYLRMNYLINYKDKEFMNMLNNEYSELIIKNLKEFIQDYGISKFVNEIGLDKVIDEIGLEKVLESIELDEIQKFLDKKKQKR